MSLGSSRELGKERQRETRRAGQPKLVTQGASDLQADVPVRLSFDNSDSGEACSRSFHCFAEELTQWGACEY